MPWSTVFNGVSWETRTHNSQPIKLITGLIAQKSLTLVVEGLQSTDVAYLLLTQHPRAILDVPMNFSLDVAKVFDGCP